MSFAMLDAAAVEGPLGGYSMFILIGAMLLAMYFLMWRPQKKREKKAQDLRSSIEIGDEVTTIGGIVGRVVSIKEDSFVLETAGERSRMRFKRWAIQEVGKLQLEGSGEMEAPPAEKKGLFSGLFGGGKKADGEG